MKLAQRLIRGPVLSVRADTPISECVRKMRDHGVGALLIVSADEHEELVGIFTERDLVSRIEVIQGTDTWIKPVSHVMTRNPRCATLGTIHEAPQLMLRIGVRHVPIIEMVGGRKRPIGVVSMRDCFRYLHESGSFQEMFQLLPGDFEPRKKLKPLGVIATGDTVGKIIAASFADEIEVRKVDPALLTGKGTSVPDLRGFAALVIDIDGFQSGEWAQLLKRLSIAGMPPSVVCYDPAKHSGMEAAVLQRLKASKHVSVFTKPLHLMEFVAQLSRFFLR